MEALLLEYLNSFPTVVLILIIVASLFTLSKGADILVDEAVQISVKWGIPKMVIGATIVSLGTTLPEATVSVFAAIEGNPDLALGNAIGSIIANSGLIIGLAALLGKLPVDRLVVKRQGKITLGAGILLAVVSLPFLSQTGQGRVNQWVGFVFLALLAIYIYFSMKWSKNTEGGTDPVEDALDVDPKNSSLMLVAKLAAGIALVILSSKVLIPTIEVSANRVGIPQSVIAATLIAFGTSLPELVTAVTAVRKGHGELAIGNIVGANILNVLFVVGAAAAVTTGGLIVPPNFFRLQIPVMLIILIAFRFFSVQKNQEITKKEGLFLLGIYMIYLVLSFTWL